MLLGLVWGQSCRRLSCLICVDVMIFSGGGGVHGFLNIIVFIFDLVRKQILVSICFIIFID